MRPLVPSPTPEEEKKITFVSQGHLKAAFTKMLNAF
jgi:hypothetical protein